MSGEAIHTSSHVPSSNVTEITHTDGGFGSHKRSPSEPNFKTTRSPIDDNKVSSHRITAQNLCRLIHTDLHYITGVPTRLKDFQDYIANQVVCASKELERLETKLKEQEDSAESEHLNILEEINELRKNVIKLKTQIPSRIKGQSQDANLFRKLQSRVSTEGGQAPKLYKDKMFQETEEFKEIEEMYNGLDIKTKNCLLCFAVFPEDATIKKRSMIYWWIGEGFIPSGSEATEEGNEIFNHLMMKGFIEPVSMNRGLKVNRCKMNPFVRTVVVILAQRARFFDFDDNGDLGNTYSFSLRACLSRHTHTHTHILAQGLAEIHDLSRLHMLFNVDVSILEFKPEWFMQMKNANIICLGRWQSTESHHIEVENPTFLESLKHMKYLKFLSLEGVSRITELPDSISKLETLVVLDIRDCPNLEVIPRGIGQLQNLTHLDMSECYLLDHMPKGLSLLTKLVVLKGFVVDESKNKRSCTVDDLAKLQNLQKLTIYTTDKKFPEHEDLQAFRKLGSLVKLTIEWGGGSLRKSSPTRQKVRSSPGKTEESIDSKGEKQESATEEKHVDEGKTSKDPQAHKQNKKENRGNAVGKPGGSAAEKERSRTILTEEEAPSSDSSIPTGLPENLEKLDLKCFPNPYTPDWLTPGRLKKLKRLYVRGGKLRDLGETVELENLVTGKERQDKWSVEILRLKYLYEMKMEWREVKNLFPNLRYLEKVKCPKLTLFPCDGYGVWMKNSNQKHLT